jgi:hypothetical protein
MDENRKSLSGISIRDKSKLDEGAQDIMGLELVIDGKFGPGCLVT